MYNALKHQSCWYDEKIYKRMMFSEILLNHSTPNFTTCFMYNITKSQYQLYPNNWYVLTHLSRLVFFSPFFPSFSPLLIKGNFFPAISNSLLESYLLSRLWLLEVDGFWWSWLFSCNVSVVWNEKYWDCFIVILIALNGQIGSAFLMLA